MLKALPQMNGAALSIAPVFLIFPPWIRSNRSPPAFCSEAMRLGLKQVDWLKSNHLIAKHRRRVVCKIFSDAKQQTLQLLFSGQDLGFTYRKVWLVGQNMAAADQMNPFAPELKIGGRIPHFWLGDKNGQRISVLNLPTIVMGADGLPFYIMLRAGKEKMAIKDFNELSDQRIVSVSLSQSETPGKFNLKHTARTKEYRRNTWIYWQTKLPALDVDLIYLHPLLLQLSAKQHLIGL